MDRLDALRVFVAVAQRRSFAEAARQRRVSATAASRAVAALEGELGVVLLHRTTRSVTLTPEGASYLEHCRTALDMLDGAARALRGEDATPRGDLVVTAPVVFGRLHVLPIVTGLLRAHPALRVELILTDRFIRLAEEGIDVALRIGELADSALHAVRVTGVRRVLVASPSYLAAHGVPADAEALARHALIAFNGAGAGGEWRFTASGRPAIRVEPRLLTNSVEASIEAAADGLGIARALSYQVEDHVRAGRLRAVLTTLEPPSMPVSLVLPANRRGSPNVRALVEAVVTRFRSSSRTPETGG